MDLVRQLKNVRFDISVRGYDCAGVDTFLATLRNDVADLQTRHQEAQQRIAELEESGGGSSETEGTLRRTLVLAQRLADETEAEAAAAAKETVSAATQEAEDLRTDAELAAAEKRQAAEEELAAARSEAEALTSSATSDAEALTLAASSEAEQSRAEARQGAEELLQVAEATGAERVQEIEAMARDEVASMREPVREEVEQLEGVRTRLLGDIADLEAHLEAQRVRVRTAVDALRAGMSGSIQDLERVADDDTIMAPEPAPEHSAASGDDVAVAPDVQIVDSVREQAAQSAPSVEALEADVDASIAASVDTETDVEPGDVVGEQATTESDMVEASPDAAGADATAIEGDVEVDPGPPTELLPVVETPEVEPVESADGASTMPDVVVEELQVENHVAVDVDDAATDGAELVEPDLAEQIPAVDVEPDVPDVAEATGGIGGAAAVVGGVIAGGAVAGGAIAGAVDHDDAPAMATAADLEEAELVMLDDEPTALFGTDLGAEAQASEPGVEASEPGVEASEPGDEGPVPAGANPGGQTFIDTLAESLDQLPVER